MNKSPDAFRTISEAAEELEHAVEAQSMWAQACGLVHSAVSTMANPLSKLFTRIIGSTGDFIHEAQLQACAAQIEGFLNF